MKINIIINSIIFGLIYFLIILSRNYTHQYRHMYVLMMMILPGLTFPLSTTKYGKVGTNMGKIFLHILCSMVTYYACVLIYVSGSKFIGMAIAGGVGSFAYLIPTKYLLKLDIHYKNVFLISVISGFSFLPMLVLHGSGFELAFSVLLWTLINGIFMDKVQKSVII
ncbi:hypothetical protein [Flavobacterium noncentrifugens]|uniref:Uncharacterized protein n=2 Tax=Flavobacterium noncentrifugens TaxID=1128970 RepID=A0A1G8W1L2_9FLAO|nr:hypothetical protein [Flavobacterium noncentrifugens]SDJ71987.1 hypothetical protein SAMN04487935_1604 [Flavobacterium noncentrifugens]